jgi:hypothetical protein
MRTDDKGQIIEDENGRRLVKPAFEHDLFRAVFKEHAGSVSQLVRQDGAAGALYEGAQAVLPFVLPGGDNKSIVLRKQEEGVQLALTIPGSLSNLLRGPDGSVVREVGQILTHQGGRVDIDPKKSSCSSEIALLLNGDTVTPAGFCGYKWSIYPPQQELATPVASQSRDSLSRQELVTSTAASSQGDGKRRDKGKGKVRDGKA